VNLAKFSKRSPIFHEIGNDVDEETSATLKKLRNRPASPDSGHFMTTEELTQLKKEYCKRQGSENFSLYGLYSFGAAQGNANDNEFQAHIVDYIVDWHRIVTERIDADMKNVKMLERDRRHYEEKVERLREKSSSVEAKGKEPSRGQVEKLDRNEEKLKDAFSKHERLAGKLCVLIEEVTHQGYKDLYPLVKKYIKWEINRAVREHDIAQCLSETLKSLDDKMGSRRSRTSLEVHNCGKEKEPAPIEAGQ
jgi:hypothetical protein